MDAVALFRQIEVGTIDQFRFTKNDCFGGTSLCRAAAVFEVKFSF